MSSMRYSCRVLIFVFSSTLAFGQRTSVTEEDFNEDGVEDVLKCSFETGSNFGGKDCTLIDGKTKNTFTLSNYGCYCDIKQHPIVSSELRKPENAYFFNALKKEVLPPFRSAPDQSLLWIINASYTTKKLTDDPYLNLTFAPNTQWRTDILEPPSTYYIEMNEMGLSKLIPMETEENRSIPLKNEKGLLVYYGHVHFSADNDHSKEFIEVAKNDTYEILKTSHGIVAKKGDAHKWLFVTDGQINGSPGKLRWESIEKVMLIDDHVVFKQNLAPDTEYHIYVINIENGMGGRLKIDFNIFDSFEIIDLTLEEQFSIQEAIIRIGRKGQLLGFPLKEIRRSLGGAH